MSESTSPSPASNALVEILGERGKHVRTAVGVDPAGWAKFGYVKMPEYRWGIFLTPPEQGRTVGFGDHFGQPAWQQVPGEYRNALAVDEPQ